METQSSPPPDNGAPRALVPISAGERGVQLKTLDEFIRFGNLVVAAQLAPRGLETPQKVALALQAGAELGFTPMQSLASIMVVNNRATVYGDGATALVRSSGLLEAAEEKYEGTFPEDEFTAVCRVKRRGIEGWTEAAFSIGDAKRAKLWGKDGPWTQYPKRQLMWRARTWARRDAFSDILRGMPDYEEMLDLQHSTEAPREVAVETPKPKTIAGLAAKLEPVDAEFSARLDQGAEAMEPKADEPKRVEIVPGWTQADLDEANAKLPAEAKAQLAHIKRQNETAAKPKKQKAAAPAPAPEKPTQTEVPKYLWYPTAETVAEMPYLVKCGFWEDWCDQPLPPSKLADLCANKGPTTWRTAAQGKKGGGRHSILLSAVTKGHKALADGFGLTEHHMRAACALHMLVSRLAEPTEEPTNAEASLFS